MSHLTDLRLAQPRTPQHLPFCFSFFPATFSLLFPLIPRLKIDDRGVVGTDTEECVR